MRGDIGLMGVPPVPPTRENPGCDAVPSPSTHTKSHTMCASTFDKVSLEKRMQLGSCH